MVFELIFLLVILVISLIFLVKGADILVDGSGDIAKHLRISPIIVGLTLVALATSLPEFVVSFFSAFKESYGISVGNVVGSNIANIGLVIGITALFTPLIIRSSSLIYELPLMILSAFFFIILANNNYLFGVNSFSLGRIDGLLLISVFFGFMYYIYVSAKKERNGKYLVEELGHKRPENSISKDVVLVLVGGLLLILGGKFFVDSASSIAFFFKVSESFIGLTLVALGTSLPELFTSMVAASKKQADIAVGNIVGSCVFNISFVLGITSLFKEIVVESSIVYFDSLIMIAFSLVLFIFAFSGRKITRIEGFFLFAGYLFYILSLVFGII